MVGVVMPHGVLFRAGTEGAIRKGMLEEDLVEAVVGLPPNLFYGTGIPAAILVLNKKKPPERRAKVLFVEASRDFGAGTNQNRLREEDVRRIASAFSNYQDVPRYTRIVGIDEIARNEYNLSLSRYVETAEASEKIDVPRALDRLRALELRRAEADSRMKASLRKLGYDA
jgi:type I restriction enzyme M protein